MPDRTCTIGLSLGADICWPTCYEEIMKRLAPVIATENGTVDFTIERVYIEPFDLEKECRYDLVIDRLTHWYHTSREWIKKAVILDDIYVFNNPWSLQSMEKHTTYCAMLKLGMPVPKTWLVPPKSYAQGQPDLAPTLRRYAKLFDLGQLGQDIGYPVFVKPYDGGAWRSVVRCDDENALRAAYEASGNEVMHVQAGVIPYDRFVRSVGLGPQFRHIAYDPSAPPHDRYTKQRDFLTDADAEHLRKVLMVINAFFGWDFNSCETLRRDGVWHPMDFANPCPDSQVTSLHYHFPWLVAAYIRWSVYCGATRRRMRRTLDWEPFFDIADSERNDVEKLDAYAAIADQRLEKHRFDEFCATHLSHLDEVVHQFFSGQQAKDAVREKVKAVFPEHEVESFTELFWRRIQDALADESYRV